jgi:hypothetical protein
LSGGLGGLGSGNSFGGTGSFSGTLSGATLGFSGINTTGGFTAGAYRSGAGGTTNMTGAARFGGIASSNLFSSTYGNPMAQGLPNATGANSRSFGTPLFNLTTTTATTGLTPGVGTASIAAGGLASLSAASAMHRAVGAYATPEGFRASGPLQVRADLQAVIARSSSLSPQSKIQVLSDGQGVVLQGTVASEHDRRLAEALVRLSPGGRVLRNELIVKSP